MRLGPGGYLKNRKLRNGKRLFCCRSVGAANKNSMGEDFHIGRLIKQYVEENGIRIGWLSKQPHCHRNTIYNIFDRNWIDTQTLMKLSQVLKHHFFGDVSHTISTFFTLL